MPLCPRAGRALQVQLPPQSKRRRPNQIEKLRGVCAIRIGAELCQSGGILARRLEPEQFRRVRSALKNSFECDQRRVNRENVNHLSQTLRSAVALGREV